MILHRTKLEKKFPSIHSEFQSQNFPIGKACSNFVFTWERKRKRISMPPSTRNWAFLFGVIGTQMFNRGIKLKKRPLLYVIPLVYGISFILRIELCMSSLLKFLYRAALMSAQLDGGLFEAFMTSHLSAQLEDLLLFGPEKLVSSFLKV